MAEERKFYTFINVTEDKDGAKNCTTVVNVSNPELKTTQAGKTVLVCRAPMNNCEKKINKALNCSFAEGETIWAEVQFWNEASERAAKFFGNKDHARLVICGRLSVNRWKNKEGKEYERIQIAVNDWTSISSKVREDSALPNYDELSLEEADNGMPY